VSNALLIFIRNAQLGKVKTRLASEIGDEMALRVYKKLLDVTRDACSQVDSDRLVFYSDHIDPEDAWGAGLFKKMVQNGPGLGERMAHAFHHALLHAGYKKAVIIGSDCADLSPTIMQHAFDALDQHDLVLGPALDGGYYLLGMKVPNAALFEDMVWSTDQVALQTKAKAEQLGLTVFLLQPLRDIDQLDDLKAIGWW
jgi:uncharacterized protein